MSHRAALASLILAALFLAGATAAAGGRLYSWRDKQGDLHYTDNIEQVPEPFRSQFLRAEQAEDAQRGDTPPAAAPAATAPKRPVPATPPASAGTGSDRPQAEEMARVRWQGEVRKLRRDIAAIEQELTEARTSRDNANRRYLETRVVARRQEAERLDAKIAKLEKTLEQLRHRLEVELPQQAREAGVPPGWLR